MSRQWVVTLSYAVNPAVEEMDRWEDDLAELEATVARVPDRGVDVTVHVDSNSLDGALKLARERSCAVIPADPVGIEILTEDEQLRRADTMVVPELWSAAEIADQLGVSRQRIHQLRSNASFPKPLADLRSGAVWSAQAIRRFSRQWSRLPGRPAVTRSVR